MQIAHANLQASSINNNILRILSPALDKIMQDLYKKEIEENIEKLLG